jgi:hypothetical protein
MGTPPAHRVRSPNEPVPGLRRRQVALVARGLAELFSIGVLVAKSYWKRFRAIAVPAASIALPLSRTLLL